MNSAIIALIVLSFVSLLIGGDLILTIIRSQTRIRVAYYCIVAPMMAAQVLLIIHSMIIAGQVDALFQSHFPKL